MIGPVCYVHLPAFRKFHVSKFSVFFFNLASRGPCIVMYCYNKSQRNALFLKFIFGIEIQMFWTGFLSIVRSLVLYTQQ